MDEKRPNITDETMIEVYNESGGQVSYSTDKVRRVFPHDASRSVSFGELKELIVHNGSSNAFEEGVLVIRDNRAREELGLSLLGEYNLDEPNITKLLKEGTLQELETFLQYTSNENLQKALRVAVDISLSDLNRTNLLMAYSGTNVLTLIQEKEEETVQATGVRKRVDGKAPAEPTTPARGRVIKDK